MAAAQDITLKVGEEAKLRGAFAGGWWIIYSGMPNKDTYSVAIRWTSGNNAAATSPRNALSPTWVSKSSPVTSIRTENEKAWVPNDLERVE